MLNLLNLAMDLMFAVSGIFAFIVAQRQLRIKGGQFKAMAYFGLSAFLLAMLLHGNIVFDAWRFGAVFCLWCVELSDFGVVTVQRRHCPPRAEPSRVKGRAA